MRGFGVRLAGSSMLVIRSAAADVEHIGLEDGLAICLAFLDLEPETFPRAANRWVARLTLERGLALAGLSSRSPRLEHWRAARHAQARKR